MAEKDQVQEEPKIETKVEDATPLADTAKGEISPAADQSDRGAAMAARMAATPPKGGRPKKIETVAEREIKDGKITNEDGTIEYVDPDELEGLEVKEDFPRDICINCRNHGRGNVKLDDKGFCKQCGFKLNRIYNMALVPAAKEE